MGSLSSLCELDLSARNSGDSELMGVTGDVPDFYYRVRMPLELAGFFWLEDLDPSALRQALSLEGIDAPELEVAEAVGVSVLCMGWNWAPWFAQNLLGEVLQTQVPDFSDASAMRHGQPPPAISTEQPVAHMEYIDDYGAIIMQPRGTRLAATVQEQARAALHRVRLDVHKETLGAVFDLLGAEVRLDRRGVWPKAAKYALVISATRFVVECSRASPKQVEVLLGHWTHYALLQRMLFAVMDEVYAFVRSGSLTEVVVPAGVRRELAMLVALAPLVRADLSLDWCPVVSMVDAGPKLGAVVYSEFSTAEVAREGRLGLVSGWAYDWIERGGELVREKVPPAPVPVSWSKRQWRLGPRQTWRQEEHNNITEGRCVVLAVQRLTRCRRGRNCRMLVVTVS